MKKITFYCSIMILMLSLNLMAKQATEIRFIEVQCFIEGAQVANYWVGKNEYSDWTDSDKNRHCYLNQFGDLDGYGEDDYYNYTVSGHSAIPTIPGIVCGIRAFTKEVPWKCHGNDGEEGIMTEYRSCEVDTVPNVANTGCDDDPMTEDCVTTGHSECKIPEPVVVEPID